MLIIEVKPDSERIIVSIVRKYSLFVLHRIATANPGPVVVPARFTNRHQRAIVVVSFPDGFEFLARDHYGARVVVKSGVLKCVVALEDRSVSAFYRRRLLTLDNRLGRLARPHHLRVCDTAAQQN